MSTQLTFVTRDGEAPVEIPSTLDAPLRILRLWDLGALSAPQVHDSALVILAPPPGVHNIEGIVEWARSLSSPATAFWVITDDAEAAQELLRSQAVEDVHVRPLHEGLFWERVQRRLRSPILPRTGDLGLALDDDWRRVRVGDTSIELTQIEYRLFLTLHEALGGVVLRSVLLEQVWSGSPGQSPKVVDLCVRRIRAKLSSITAHVQIRTIRGKGYALDLQPSSSNLKASTG